MLENLELVIRKLLLSIDERKTSSRTKNTESNHGTKLSTYNLLVLMKIIICDHLLHVFSSQIEY